MPGYDPNSTPFKSNLNDSGRLVIRGLFIVHPDIAG